MARRTSERLAVPGAAFLDVGVGVAALSIAMVRQWPSLRVVGLDPWAASLAIARRNVQGAGLAPQIELREMGGEDLADFAAYDLAWIPSLFIPQGSIARIVDRVGRALRPGGWLLFPMLEPGDDPLVAAARRRFRTALWGGSELSAEAVTTLLTGAGFVDVRLLPGHCRRGDRHRGGVAAEGRDRTSLLARATPVARLFMLIWTASPPARSCS